MSGVPPTEPLVISPGRERILSVDVFRGLTMLTMIFANDLDMAGINNVPLWMKHSKVLEYFTFVDVIAPAFLFIVGVSAPLAIERRRAGGASWLNIWFHILIRTASLMIIGIYMGNMRAHTVKVCIGISHAWWSVLLLSSFLLIWNDYPAATGRKRWLYIGMRLIGIAVLIYLALVYREEQKGHIVCMQLRWYVIGVIGWSYLLACIVYCLFRRQPAGIVGFLALLILVYIADQAHVFDRFGFLSGFRRRVSFGNLIAAQGMKSVCGVLVGMLFASSQVVHTPGRRIVWILILGMGVFLAGLLLHPIYGLAPSAIKVTPVLSCYCLTISCVIFAFLYWLIDIRQIRRWSLFSMPAGRNALLPYFLAFMFHPLTKVIGVDWINDNYLNNGLVGILRTAGVAVFIGIIMTAWLSRLGVRLRL